MNGYEYDAVEINCQLFCTEMGYNLHLRLNVKQHPNGSSSFPNTHDLCMTPSTVAFFYFDKRLTTNNQLTFFFSIGRGKMKKMMGMMMMGFAMKMAALVPVAIAGLYLLAGKALIVSKIALLLAGIIGLKKLLSSKQGGGGGGSSGGWSSGGGGGGGGWQSSGHGGGGGGWDRRSNEAQNLAYSAYQYQNQQV